MLHRPDLKAWSTKRSISMELHSPFQVGSCYKLLHPSTVRVGAELESAVVVELPSAAGVEVLELGTAGSQRLRVNSLSGGYCGWLSCTSMDGVSLLDTQPFHKPAEPVKSITPYAFADDLSPYAPFFVGARGIVVSEVTVREGAELHTDVICDLPVGTRLRLEEFAKGRRARVVSDSASGWVSIRTRSGMPLISPPEAEGAEKIKAKSTWMRPFSDERDDPPDRI